MITYKLDQPDKYIEEIIKHLDEFEIPFTGTIERESRSFYAVDEDELVGAVNVFYNSNWVMILDLFYENQTVLNDLINEICVRYNHKANGIHMRTYDEVRLGEFLESGFKQVASITSSTDNSDLFMADLSLPFKQQSIRNKVVSTSLRNEEYQKVLDEEFKKSLHYIKTPKLIEDVTIIATKGETFVGGLVAKANEDSFHIDLLVVPKEYRGKNIGKTMMLMAEDEAIKRGIGTMDLSTGEYGTKPFYEKLGYRVVYTRENHPTGYKNFKLIKHIKGQLTR